VEEGDDVTFLEALKKGGGRLRRPLFGLLGDAWVELRRDGGGARWFVVSPSKAFPGCHDWEPTGLDLADYLATDWETP
jgi:hypothetical protein